MLEKSEKSASSWLKTHNCFRMHGQQNIKNGTGLCVASGLSTGKQLPTL
jgi:hypothetical protein